jgi:hypothetical protein
MADGKTRCLPPWNNVRYGDMSCTPASALISVVKSDPLPSYVGTWSGDSCTGGYQLFSVGAQLPTPIDFYDPSGNGGCVANPFAHASTVLAAYAIGAEVSPSTFAEARLVTE